MGASVGDRGFGPAGTGETKRRGQLVCQVMDEVMNQMWL